MDCYPDAAERAGVLRKFGFASRIMRALNRALFRRLDHLVCLDQAMVDLLLSQYGPKDRTLPTTIIPNWERGDLFPPGQSHPPWDQIQSLGLHDRLIVLYLGNAGVGHPFETVMEAAKVLRDEPITFLFVGGGKRWPWLQQAKQQHDLDSLVFCDYIQKESTPSVMQAAGCALITLGSDMLGVMSPSKLHSNLAMHLPILYVGPQTSNVDEAISRYSCGVSLREGDSDGIVKFLRSLLADKALHAGLRQRARNAFDMAYSDCRTLPQWHSVIQQFK
jgi:glycosyltransferase involved in cell wall biosynthesis